MLAPKEFVRSEAELARQYSGAEAEAYTRALARAHYENFHVATWLLPRGLRQDFCNVYAYCRWADDLGDEIGEAAESLRLLGWWRGELEAMYAGRARHPVFVALRRTVERHALPMEPLADLIRAFEQDQRVNRYRNWEEVYGYCRYSANPVGRLVLHLCGYRDAERQRLSDATCTGLQLANFWQDVAVDLSKGRVYLPLEVLERHGCRLEDLEARRATGAFRATLREAVGVARRWLEQGVPLAGKVAGRLAVDVDLFSRGGLKILEKIEAQDYDVLSRRPAVGGMERAGLLLGSMWRAWARREA